MYKRQDVHNRIVGRYKNGLLDSSLVNGKNLYTSIDADLQSYGEDLMNNKRGAIVAINPKTGEIITLVSAPSYDPNPVSYTHLDVYKRQITCRKLYKNNYNYFWKKVIYKFTLLLLLILLKLKKRKILYEEKY